jgi:predicted GTPase
MIRIQIKNMYDFTMDNSNKLDTKLTIKLLNESFSHIEQCTGKNIVLCLGNTGAGKSTLTNYLNGCKFVYMMQKFRLVLLPLDKSKIFTEIGSGNISMTSYPHIVGKFMRPTVASYGTPVLTREHVYKLDKSPIVYGKSVLSVENKLNRSQEVSSEEEPLVPLIHKMSDSEDEVKNEFEELSIADCPGFEDVRGIEHRLTVSICYQMTIEKSNSIKGLIFVIEFYSLFTGRAHGLRSLMKNILDMINSTQAIKDSVIFVITKIPTEHCGEKISEENIKEHCSEFIKELTETIEKNKTYKTLSDKTIEEYGLQIELLKLIEHCPVVLLHITDDGADRIKILNLIYKCAEIDKKVFQFPKQNGVNYYFDKLVYTIAFQGLELYNEEKNTLANLKFYKDRLNEIQESKKFYSLEFKREDDGIADYKSHITNLDKLINDLTNKRTLLENEIIKIRSDIQNLDVDTPKVLIRNEYYDKRMFFFGFFSWSVKYFEYTGQSFLFAKKGHVDKGEFCDLVEDKKNGNYNVTYKSGWGIDGNAYIEIYVRTKNHPNDSGMLNLLKTSLDSKLKTLNAHNDNLTKHFDNKIKYEKILKIKVGSEEKTKMEMNSSLKELDESNDKILQNINKTESKLNDISKKIKDKRSDIDIFFKLLSLLNFESDMVEEFIKKHNERALPESYNLDELISKNIPNKYVCHISRAVMDDPVKAECGHVFDRQYILRCMSTKNSVNCIVCSKKIIKSKLKPERELRKEISIWYDKLRNESDESDEL